MDACEHEYESMSRHNRKVPASFYHRFARDACVLSDKYAGGRLISALEGGYSDRALTSGAMAHLTGLVDVPEGTKVDEGWWSLDNLIKVNMLSYIPFLLVSTHRAIFCLLVGESHEETTRCPPLSSRTRISWALAWKHTGHFHSSRKCCFWCIRPLETPYICSCPGAREW